MIPGTTFKQPGINKVIFKNNFQIDPLQKMQRPLLGKKTPTLQHHSQETQILSNMLETREASNCII